MWHRIEDKKPPEDGSAVLLAVEVLGGPIHPTKAGKHLYWAFEIAESYDYGFNIPNPEAGWDGPDFTHWSPIEPPND